MRLLFVIPHYFKRSEDATTQSGLENRHGSTSGQIAVRTRSLQRCVFSLKQNLGSSQAIIRHVDRRVEPANEASRHEVHVVVVTTGGSHLIQEAKFPPDLIHQFSVDDNPKHLGFLAQRVLRDRWGNYDYYCYLEDDLAIEDPWFFEKLRWFNSYVGDDKVLLPQRFERSENHTYKKVYLDGDLAKRVTEPFQNIDELPELKSEVLGKSVRFVRPPNPHSGCFFLNANQMQHWIAQPYFEPIDTSFIGPLESAATLGVMKTFDIYKPARENASFFEIEHADRRFISLIRFADQ
ncbi:MAG: hypothetical protein P1U77_03980 [Rubripirellula sp.]|jgi:hypothetical protein|nr:hypothetical protein [Rubripirellula sp.]